MLTFGKLWLWHFGAVICWGSRFGPTDLGPMIVLPAWVAFWLLSRAFSRRCVPPQFLHVFVLMAWTLVGLFMSLSWIWDAVASYVLPSLGASSREKPGPLRAGSSACRDLCSWRWSAPASARLILLERRRISTPAACAGWQSRPAIGVSGHQLQSSNPEIVCRLKLFFEPAEDCRWCLLLFRQGPWIEVPESFFPHLEKNVGSLLSLWDLLRCKVQLQSLREELKTLGMAVCGPVYPGSVVHFAWISVRLLPRWQDFGSLLCSLF